jgi:hypothetical protein
MKPILVYLILLLGDDPTARGVIGPLPYTIDQCWESLSDLKMQEGADPEEYAKVKPICVLSDKMPIPGVTQFILQDDTVHDLQ